jgi:sulfur-oxidizing protein SoxY
MTPNPIRRRALRAMMIVSAWMVMPWRALAAAWNKPAFEAPRLEDALKLIGAQAAIESPDIEFKAPEIAENGAIVPIEITSRLPQTQAVYVFAEKNPFPLTASFEFLKGAEPFIATRIKMAESSRLEVVVRSAGKYYRTSREVKVTIGGCGTS